jgi:enoyl-CoA hydratase/carnithine racemase
VSSDQSNVVLEVKDSVAIVRLNRPERMNAFTFKMVAEIRAAADRAAADEKAVGIIITGAGRAFSAGLDAVDLARSTSGTAQSDIESSTPATDDLPALFSYLLRIPKPVIAAVNGVAAGGGFVLAMMSDLRFAAESASFTTIFSKRGLLEPVARSICYGARGASMRPRRGASASSIASCRTSGCSMKPAPTFAISRPACRPVHWQ